MSYFAPSTASEAVVFSFLSAKDLCVLCHLNKQYKMSSSYMRKSHMHSLTFYMQSCFNLEKRPLETKKAYFKRNSFPYMAKRYQNRLQFYVKQKKWTIKPVHIFLCTFSLLFSAHSFLRYFSHFLEHELLCSDKTFSNESIPQEIVLKRIEQLEGQKMRDIGLLFLSFVSIIFWWLDSTLNYPLSNTAIKIVVVIEKGLFFSFIVETIGALSWKRE